jgi:hypothetical protein
MLSDYHQKYAGMFDAEIVHRAQVKDQQIRQVFVTIGMPQFAAPTVRIAVLGCADKRFIELHRRLFESLLGKPVAVTTIDITVEHLVGAAGGIVQHDATLPLPLGPYDLIYADVLVRFVPSDKQYAILQNAYDALDSNGIALMVFAHEDYDPPPAYQPLAGTHRVDMNALQLELAKRKIQFMEVPTTIETVPPGSDKKISIEDLFLVLRKSY